MSRNRPSSARWCQAGSASPPPRGSTSCASVSHRRAACGHRLHGGQYHCHDGSRVAYSACRRQKTVHRQFARRHRVLPDSSPLSLLTALMNTAHLHLIPLRHSCLSDRRTGRGRGKRHGRRCGKSHRAPRRSRRCRSGGCVGDGCVRSGWLGGFPPPAHGPQLVWRDDSAGSGRRERPDGLGSEPRRTGASSGDSLRYGPGWAGRTSSRLTRDMNSDPRPSCCE